MPSVVDFPLMPSGHAPRAELAPVQDTISRLEEMLEMAKSGKLRAFAATLIEGPAIVSSTWAATDGWYHEVTSGLATLQFRWLCANSEFRPDQNAS